MASQVYPLADQASLNSSEALPRRYGARASTGNTGRAVQELAAKMATEPAGVLPRFVELAMEMTGARSAGLSLLEPDPAAGVYRWRHLHGILAPFENVAVSRQDSPWDGAFVPDEVTLCRDPEQICGWITADSQLIPEVLLVPLQVPGDEPLGTLWLVATHEGEFDERHAVGLAQLASFAATALKMIRTEQALRANLDEQELLTREMSHRLNNLFALTEGMIRGSARTAQSVNDLADALSGRLLALASANSIVQRKVGAGDHTRLDLAGLITSIVLAHESAGADKRISLSGAALFCGPHAVNSMALVMHELATNAAKYGALSNEGGRVAVVWRRDGNDIVIDWRERGGPPVGGAPGRRGFGTSLITATVERQFRGSVTSDWAAEGLSVALRIPAQALGT